MAVEFRFLLGYGNLVEDATIGGVGSWLAAAPATNVATWGLAETARSSDALAASTKIRLDHGSAKAARVLLLMGHNLSSAATVRWMRGSSAGGTEVMDSGAVNAWQFTPRGAADGSIYEAQVVQASQALARYEQIEIVDTGNAAGYVDIGRIFLGPALQPTYNPSWGLRDGHEPLDKLGLAYGGADWPQRNRRPRRVQFALDWLTLAEGDTVHEIEQIEGTTEEVAYLPYSSAPARMQRYGMVGQLQQLDGILYPTVNTRSRAFAIRQRV